MIESMLYFWLTFGAILVFAEIILPGLVSVFVGLGALTVAGLLHFQVIDSILVQLTTWFISSTIYIFSLRLLVMKYYPSDRKKHDINEDYAVIGTQARVVEKITGSENGRIEFGESTWIAIGEEDQEIPVGDTVEIVGRNNISWVVKTIHKKEN